MKNQVAFEVRVNFIILVHDLSLEYGGEGLERTASKSGVMMVGYVCWGNGRRHFERIEDLYLITYAAAHPVV